jgi:hypothetical protein
MSEILTAQQRDLVRSVKYRDDQEQYNYIKSCGRILSTNNRNGGGLQALVVLTQPLYGFKKAMGERIVNLTIPVGSIVHVSDEEAKCRTNLARVHSIWDPRNKIKVGYGTSKWDNTFLYKTNQLVVPKRDFSMRHGVCTSGIHFYLNIVDALNFYG